VASARSAAPRTLLARHAEPGTAIRFVAANLAHLARTHLAVGRATGRERQTSANSWRHGVAAPRATVVAGRAKLALYPASLKQHATHLTVDPGGAGTAAAVLFLGAGIAGHEALSRVGHAHGTGATVTTAILVGVAHRSVLRAAIEPADELGLTATRQRTTLTRVGAGGTERQTAGRRTATDSVGRIQAAQTRTALGGGFAGLSVVVSGTAPIAVRSARVSILLCASGAIFGSERLEHRHPPLACAGRP
jgi:hypothetical protein